MLLRYNTLSTLFIKQECLILNQYEYLQKFSEIYNYNKAELTEDRGPTHNRSQSHHRQSVNANQPSVHVFG